ncbi:aquaporin family protein [Clostridium sp. CS001]|uniref:MIP/aquaporin family protein n=1 Tax=Clostridium sp. CS001 TaxID=2880648 RepID=UPI001CF47688|nr:MIP/aquaporin family protein [Clostridium sp. CS001]MCB2289802.1 aquaporin family protein [Clostridium sp. CS001]
MSIYLAEFLGTAMLILLGDAVVANVLLNKTKGNNSGLIVIAFGWALAVAIPAFIFGPISGASFNPALTLSLAVIGKFPWEQVPGYIVAQMGGAIVGACLVYLHYRDHFEATEDADLKRAVFCTGPAIRNTFQNFVSEFIGTFILVFALLGFVNTKFADGVGGLVVGGIILVIGLTLGGTTGYAINPARDLGPRIAHAFLPIKNKQGSDWGYAWIPVVAPICGAIVAAVFFKSVF